MAEYNGQSFVEELQKRIENDEATLIAIESGDIDETTLICPRKYIERDFQLAKDYLFNLKIIARYAMKNKPEQEDKKEKEE